MHELPLFCLSAKRNNVPVDFRENQSFRYRYFGGVKPESKLAAWWLVKLFEMQKG